MTVKRWMYDVLYRVGAPWEGGVRENLVELVKENRISPTEQKRVLDLGCGSGTCSVYLAEQGFDDVTGVDFTPVALRKARKAAAAAGVTDRVRFVKGNLTRPSIPGVEGTYDLLLDFGTLDDLTGQDRLDMAANFKRFSHPGSMVVLWCFYTESDDEELPRFAFQGVSRFLSGIRPGEEHELFGDDFTIERLPEPPLDSKMACFLMVRK
ncbi:class I SAM-dependent methyltransferase [Streptomyces marispadix]|uniref:Class I SAM-dependent methyltransferase n=1 Tax=Streptomyces marispadix TaxID=2922868 RepID=A0ABS9ST54_9ACTN|nr:class I SAM-dependent methyltransferase [Streptomyces marispadix]MCH6159353.1 class I SAM-dependent methyltransferase [Streptomyces marispadix]